jgi:hypothetical protein
MTRVQPEGASTGTGGKEIAPRRRRVERVFAMVGAALAVLLVLGAAPGWYLVKGYRRARWADQRGIELVVKAEFGDFGASLRARQGALLGRERLDAAAYRKLQEPGALKEEAGGDFWSGFYGMGTQLYHHTAGNRAHEPVSAEELRRARREEAERRERRAAELAAKLDPLIRQLGDDDFRKRDAASAAILEIGKPALPTLAKAARSGDPEVANRASQLIEEIKLPPSARRKLEPEPAEPPTPESVPPRK